MKGFASLCLLALFAVPTFAQGGRYGFGFGNVVFPGGIPRATRYPFSIADTTFPQRLSGIVNGLNPYTGAPTGGGAARRAFFVPYGVPVYMGGYYPNYPAEQAPVNVTIVNPAPQAPQVVLNQTFASETARPAVQEYAQDQANPSGVRVYQAPSASPAVEATDSKPTIYLIAFNDGSVQAALAYWTEGDTLGYVTAQGRANKASLSLVDRDLSNRLNRERGVEFRPVGR